jgi:uncharacterized protein YkwD
MLISVQCLTPHLEEIVNRALGAVLCIGSLTAIGAPLAPAYAEAQQASCRVVASKPFVSSTGKIGAVGARAGCVDKALFRVRIKKVVAGPDRIVKSGSKTLVNGKVRLSLKCASGVFYTVVTDYRGHTATSKKARLKCLPASTASGDTGTSVGTAVENEVVRLTNIERAKNGCGALKHDARLRAAAFGHSSDMSANNYFDHNSRDGRDFADRIRAAGFSFTAAAENIAQGYPTAAAVVKGWMNSPGHQRNILNCAYTHIGVGYAANGSYWTQDFARP